MFESAFVIFFNKKHFFVFFWEFYTLIWKCLSFFRILRIIRKTASSEAPNKRKPVRAILLYTVTEKMTSCATNLNFLLEVALHALGSIDDQHDVYFARRRALNIGTG